nr:immunoglobulin heavy chain junction region [Mus musculus]
LLCKTLLLRRPLLVLRC